MPVQSAKGIPDRSIYGNIDKLRSGSILDFILQQHLARKAGPHEDLRVGNKDLGLYSFALRKGLPPPGKKHLAVIQPLHSHSYGAFEGEIPEGQYGAGTVKNKMTGQALITKASPEHINFTIAHKKYPLRYTLVRPEKFDQKDWLLLNTTPTKPLPFNKEHYPTIKAENAEETLRGISPNTVVEPKVDGALTLLQLLKDKAEVMSYRTSKTHGGPLVHTERVFGTIPQVTPRKEDVNSVLQGELYGLRGNKVISSQELTPLLNSSLSNSLARQKAKKIQLKTMIFDILQRGNKKVDRNEVEYKDRLNIVKDILGSVKGNDSRLFSEHVHAPETADTPEAAVKLWDAVNKDKHPLTSEGVIVHRPYGKPQKIKKFEDQDVVIRGFFPGKGQFENKGVGGFVYSKTTSGPILGEVGTGFDVSTRVNMFEHPEMYVGRKAKIQHRGQLNSGAYFQPSLLSLRLD